MYWQFYKNIFYAHIIGVVYYQVSTMTVDCRRKKKILTIIYSVEYNFTDLGSSTPNVSRLLRLNMLI